MNSKVYSIRLPYDVAMAFEERAAELEVTPYAFAKEVFNYLSGMEHERFNTLIENIKTIAKMTEKTELLYNKAVQDYDEIFARLKGQVLLNKEQELNVSQNTHERRMQTA